MKKSMEEFCVKRVLKPFLRMKNIHASNKRKKNDRIEEPDSNSKR